MSDVRRFPADEAMWESGTSQRGCEVVLANDYDALAARVAQLEEQARDFHNVDDVRRLKEARPYMQHMVGCDFRSCEGPCTCGLNAWLAGEKD